MTPLSRAHFALVILIILNLNGCSWFEQEPRPKELKRAPAAEVGTQTSDTSSSAVEIKRLEKQEVHESTLSDIEVTWKVPDAPVDGFTIHYGYSPTNISSDVRVEARTLIPEEDPRLGPVYRYRLVNLPKTTPVYVTISAYLGAEESYPSDPMEVQP